MKRSSGTIMIAVAAAAMLWGIRLGTPDPYVPLKQAE
jgi:hypothetical protein